MPDRKSLLEMARECERRARAVQSEGDCAQLKQIAKDLKEVAARHSAAPAADQLDRTGDNRRHKRKRA